MRIGATVASLGLLLSLLVGISRTSFAMAAEGDLPRWLDAVHPVRRVPHRAETTVAVAVIAVVLIADVRGAIGFSSFAVLTYYGITNVSAWTLSPTERPSPKGLSALGFVGCIALGFSQTTSSIVGGAIVPLAPSCSWSGGVHHRRPKAPNRRAKSTERASPIGYRVTPART